MPLIFTRNHISVAATALAVLLSATACGSGNEGDIKEDITPSPVATVVSPSATPSSNTSFSAAPLPSSSAPSVKSSQVPSKIPLKGLATNSYGSYLQTTITNDDPAMQYNPDNVEDRLKEKYSEEDLLAAQRLAIKFIAEETIDSPLRGSPADVDKWWDENSDRFLPFWQQGLYKDIKERNKDLVILDAEIAESADKYNFVYSPNEPRVLEREITPVSITYLAGDIVVEADISYVMKMTPNESLGKSDRLTGKANVKYSMSQSASTGKWILTSYENTVYPHTY